jgi:GT2 family glycosyltransferase
MTARPDAAAALARAQALRDQLRDALATARASLADAEANNAALHRELERMTASRARQRLVRLRWMGTRAARAVRHPFWTAGTVLRGAAARGPAAAVQQIAAHALVRGIPLRQTAPVRRWADGADQTLALRWVGPINIRHRRVEALLCHPPAGVEYQVTAPSRSTFVCECALSPEVWQAHPPAVTFHVRLECAAAGWQREASLTIDPGARWTERRWHRLEIPLPQVESPALDVTVSLTTSVPGGPRADSAWALFGEPRFEWRRSTAEVRSSMATFLRLFRTGGAGQALQLLRLKGLSAPPPDTYPRWVARHTRSAEALEDFARTVAALPLQPRISIVTPVYNTEPRWLRACIESVRRQAYANWELCLCDDASTRPETIEVLREYEGQPNIRIHYAGENGGISAASNLALALATGEFVALLDHDDELTPDALAEVVAHVNAHPDADVVYSDEDKLDESGSRCDPFFKPDWSPEHFLSCMYSCHLMVVRKRLIDAVGGFRRGYEGAQDYDLLLRLMERTSHIDHLPRVLYHWRKVPGSTAAAGLAKPWALDAGRQALEDHVRRRGIDAEVEPGYAPGLYRVHRHIRGTPLVSLVIPTAGRPRRLPGGREVDILAQAVRSVVARTSWPHYEFVIVADAAGVSDAALAALDGTRHQVLRFERLGLFNFSAKINAGVAASSGEHVLLFNDDLEAMEPDWLEAMLEYSQDPEVGAVGPKLLYPDGRLQHIGIVLGVGGVASHVFHQQPGVSTGYAGSAVIARNYSAVTAACLMSRRQVFDEAGGFDERFPIDFNDVDYCLRVRRAGYRIVFTPWARLTHHESASFGTRHYDPVVLAEMRRRWGQAIERDPYYNPNLTRDFTDCRVDA